MRLDLASRRKAAGCHEERGFLQASGLIDPIAHWIRMAKTYAKPAVEQGCYRRVHYARTPRGCEHYFLSHPTVLVEKHRLRPQHRIRHRVEKLYFTLRTSPRTLRWAHTQNDSHCPHT